MSTGTPPNARLAEELLLLVDALAERAQPWLRRMADGQQGEHTPATCGWCPLCAAIALVRGERPELAMRLAEHAAGMIAVLRASLDQMSEHPPTPSPRSESSTSEESTTEQSTVDKEGEWPPSSPRVQHIMVQRVTEDRGDREC